MDDEDLTLPSSDEEDDATIASGGAGEPTEPPQAGSSGSSITFGGSAKQTPEEISATTELKVGATIAQGGMGAILEANDPALDRTVAMKVMLPEADSSDGARQRFVREAMVLARLEHPNIVPIQQLGRDENDRPFYTMKLVKGRTLQAIISELAKGNEQTIADFPLNRLLTIFRQICDAIAFAHHRGVIHRDLKPENVMVGEFGETLVMDWGLAKILNDPEEHPFGKPKEKEEERPFADLLSSQMTDSAELTMDGAVMGSPKYMAPEQAEGKIGQLDERTDIYSLGGVLYAILTLHPPVSGSSVVEVLQNVRSGNLTPPTEFNAKGSRSSPALKEPREEASVGALPHCAGGLVPSALSSVTMQAMALRTTDRYQTVAELSADIEKFQGGFATSVEDLGAFQQFRLLIARHKVASMAIAVSFLVIASLTAFYLVDVTKKERLAQENFQRAETNAFKARVESTNATTARREAESTATELRRTLTLNYFNRGIDLLEGDEAAKGLAFVARALRTDTNYWPAAARIATALQQRNWPLNLREPIRLQHNLSRMAAGPIPDTVWLYGVNGGLELWDFERNKRLFKTDGDPNQDSGGAISASPVQNRWVETLISHGHSVESALSRRMGNPVLEIVLSPDGTKACTWDIGCNHWLWDLKTGKVIVKARPGSTIEGWGKTHVEKSPFTGAAYSHDGKFVVLWSNRRIGAECGFELRDGTTGELLREPFKVPGRVKTVRFAETSEVPRLLVCERSAFEKGISIDPWAGALAVPVNNLWGDRLSASDVSEDGRVWSKVIWKGWVRIGRGTTDKSWGKNVEPEGFHAVATKLDPKMRWVAAVGTNAFQIFSLKTRRPVSPVQRFQGHVTTLAFESGDEFTFTTTNAAGESFSHRFKPEKEQSYRRVPISVPKRSWQTSADGLSVSVPSQGNFLEVRDGDGRLINTITPSVPVADITKVRSSPDGLRLATIDKNRTTQLWDVIGGRALGSPIPTSEATGARFTPDSASFLMHSRKRPEFVVYDAWSGRKRLPIRHESENAAKVPKIFNRQRSAGLAWYQNAVIGGGGTAELHLVDLDRLQNPVEQRQPLSGHRGIVIAGDGDSFVARYETNGLSFVTYSRISEPKVQIRIPMSDSPSDMFLSASGTRLATVHGFHRLHWWDLTEGKPLRELRFDDRIKEVHLSANGERMITITGTNELASWSSSKSGPDWVMPDAIHPQAPLSSIRISPDDRLLAIPNSPTEVRLVEMSSGVIVRTLPHPSTGVKYLVEFVFSPSSKHLAVLAQEELAVYEVATGQRKARRQVLVMDVRFASSEDILALDLGKENGARLEFWNWRQDRVQAGPFDLPWSTKGMAFDPAGKTLAVNTRDQLQLFAADTGRQLADPIRLRLGEFVQPTFDSLGSPVIVNGLGRRIQKLWTEPEHRVRNILAAEQSGIIHRFSFPSSEESIPAWLPSFAEAVAGLRINSEGAVETVDLAQRVSARAARLASETPGYFDRLARWIHADRDARPVVFGSKESRADYLDRALKESQDIGDLYELLKGYPAEGRVYAAIGLRLAQDQGRYWIPPEQRVPRASMEFIYVPESEFETIDAGQRRGVQRAIRWYDQQAAELDPDDPLTLATRAEIAAEQGNWPRAVQLIDDAIASDSAAIRSQYLKSFYLHRMRKDSTNGYKLFRATAQRESRLRSGTVELVITEFMQTERIPDAWLMRLSGEQADDNGARYLYSKIVPTSERALDMRDPNFRDLLGENELQVLNRARGGNAQGFFEFAVPDPGGARILGANLELTYAEVKKPVPHQADLISANDWHPERLTWETRPPVQARLAEWEVRNGRLRIPLAITSLDGYASPGKKWIVRISQEAVLGGSFPVIKGRETRDADQRPVLKLLQMIETEKK